MSIEVRNVSKTFGSYQALRNVNLTVNTGELTALLGPSGSGKTTLLRIIAGLERADEGSGPILFHEADVARRGVGERNVGFVFQHYALFRHMTVFQNVAFGLKVRPWRSRPSRSVIKDKVHHLLRLVQLEGLAHRYPNQLSGGQRQRVALARALATEPSVLLLDEPFGALDAKVRQELRDWLRKLHDEIHVTSVFVTHDQDEALEVADRVVVMHRGQIEQEGTPDEVFHRPKTEFVMSFLGKVNQFHGRLERGELRFADVALPVPNVAAADGSSGKVFIRPHEVDLATTSNGHPTLQATVQRVHSAGSIARVELATTTGELLHVEVPQERFRALGVAVGSTVYATPKNLRVFGADVENAKEIDLGSGI